MAAAGRYCKTVPEDFPTVIWPILQKVGFRYSGGVYRHPQISDVFIGQDNVASYLCKNGIPIVDSLEPEERQNLETYVKFSHVPHADFSTARGSSLGSLKLTHELLPDDEIQGPLETLGFEFVAQGNKKPVIWAPGAKDLEAKGVPMICGVHYFLSLEEVQLYVRSNQILAVEPPNGAVTRCRQYPSLRSQERLWVRLWAATSNQPLPTFHPSPAQQSSSKATKKRRPADVAAQNTNNDVTGTKGPRKRACLMPSPGQKTQEELGSCTSNKRHHKNVGESGKRAASKKSSGKKELDQPNKELAEKGENEQTEAQDQGQNQDQNRVQESATLQPDQALSGQWRIPQQGRSLKSQYHLLRMDLHIQRQIRNANREEVGLDPIPDTPFPAEPPSEEAELKRVLSKLQRDLNSVCFEIELLLEQSPVLSE